MISTELGFVSPELSRVVAVAARRRRVLRKSNSENTYKPRDVMAITHGPINGGRRTADGRSVVRDDDTQTRTHTRDKSALSHANNTA